MKVIRDSIHKDIYIEDEILKIIDSEEFQRLRNIKQLGLANLVYPSANHTRFEHSLGTMFISQKIAEKIDDIDIELVKISALLHDIGHPPFSHTLEILNYNHEKVGKKIIKKMDLGVFSNKEILDVLSGKRLESEIISGDVDADRMDYLLRDSYHTGTAYGLIDLPRIIRSLKTFEYFGKVKIGVIKKGIQAIESLLVARHQMYSAVYMHKTVRIVNTMLKRAVIEEIKNNNLNIEELKYMDDIDLVSRLRSCENYLMNFIDRRELYKKVLEFSYNELTPKQRWILVNIDEKEILKLEEKLKNIFGYDIFIDIYPLPKIEEHNIYILSDNKVDKLDNISKIANSLKLAERDLWKVCMYSKNRDINIKEIKNLIFKELDKNYSSEVLRIINEFKIIEGKGRFLELAKDSGLTTKEFNEELYKLVFCGLIKEEYSKNKYIYKI
ncbi:HD domain-containing protein [Methanocaldococcus indicus]|uniref:HD domain-containing protein n=1 Tax=Methanocaldococcus indicus TaxID=213231 RepID=UPI003C6DA006